MTQEQKEGIIIATLVFSIIAILALVSDWRGGLHQAYFGFSGFELSGGTYSDLTKGKEIILDFHVRFTTALAVLLPFLAYGVLRALSVVRRLFSFEKNLSHFVSLRPSELTAAVSDHRMPDHAVPEELPLTQQQNSKSIPVATPAKKVTRHRQER